MVEGVSSENKRYKLLGFEGSKGLAVIMVVSSGKVVRVKLGELLSGEMIETLTKGEVKEIYRKFYSRGTVSTAYEMTDRHERSWAVYVVLNLVLLVFYIFSNVSAAKLIYLEGLNVAVTPGLFVYPLTFFIVDLLNEFYGMRLARKAILLAFVSNALIILLLGLAGNLPGLPGWGMDLHFSQVVNHVLAVLLASSVSFLLSENLNSYLLCKIKELTSSRYLFLRVFFSTFFAVIIDSVVFCVIAFYSSMDSDQLMQLIYIQIAVKICFAVFSVLPAYGARSLFRKYVSEGQTA